MEKISKNKINFREFWKIVKKRKHLIIWPFLIILAGAVALAFRSQPTYECSSTIVIEEKSKGRLSGSAEKLILLGKNRLKMDLIRRDILSHSNLIRLIELLDLKKDDEIRKYAIIVKEKYPNIGMNEIMELKLIEDLKKKIEIKAKNNVIQINFEGRYPDKTYLIVKTLTQMLIDNLLKNEQEDIRHIIEFSANQLKKYRDKLKESEKKLQKFQQRITEKKIKNPSGKLGENFEQYNSMLATTEIELEQKKDLMNYFDSKIKKSSNTISFSNSPQLKKLDQELTEIVYRMQKFMKQFPPGHPEIMKLNEEIALKRREQREEIERITLTKSSIKDDSLRKLIIRKEILIKDINFLEEMTAALSRLLTSYKKNISNEPLEAMSLAELEKEVEQNREIYNMFLIQSQGSQLAEALQERDAATKFRILEPPIKPFQPTSTKKRIIFLGFIFGITVSFGMVSIFEKMDHSFKDIEAVEKAVGIEVLGTIPKMNFQTQNGSVNIKKVRYR